ncbi:MAG: hypothetical protein HY360_22165 [Verrucomicrobia bacterium]|nr:hypothetical protein [Verrucomicrobiota bacterium]
MEQIEQIAIKGLTVHPQAACLPMLSEQHPRFLQPALFMFVLNATILDADEMPLISQMFHETSPSKILSELLNYEYQDSTFGTETEKMALSEAQSVIAGILIEPIRKLPCKYGIHYTSGSKFDAAQAIYETKKYQLQIVQNGNVLLVCVKSSDGTPLLTPADKNNAVVKLAGIAREIFKDGNKIELKVLKEQGKEMIGIHQNGAPKTWACALPWWTDGQSVVFAGAAFFHYEGEPSSRRFATNQIDLQTNWSGRITHAVNYNQKRKKMAEANDESEIHPTKAVSQVETFPLLNRVISDYDPSPVPEMLLSQSYTTNGVQGGLERYCLEGRLLYQERMLAPEVVRNHVSTMVHYCTDGGSDGFRVRYALDDKWVDIFWGLDLLLVQIHSTNAQSILANIKASTVVNQVSQLARSIFAIKLIEKPVLTQSDKSVFWGSVEGDRLKVGEFIYKPRWWTDGQSVVFGMAIPYTEHRSSRFLANSLSLTNWFAVYRKTYERQELRRRGIEAEQKRMDEEEAKAEAKIQRQEKEREAAATNALNRAKSR